MPLPNYPYAGKDTLTKNDILETLQHWITVMQLKPGEKDIRYGDRRVF